MPCRKLKVIWEIGDYRSRHAEAVFNHHAASVGLGWRATSRGLALGEVRAFAAPAETSPKDEPLRSVSTNNFAALLASLNVSLAVSTYQAGKLILLRADGDKLNTHFRAMQMPMGLALRGNRLAVGAGMQVWQFQNQPEPARLLEPADKHDACFVPRQCHWTGDIRVHEIAFTGDGQLWVVNTRFSCLCTLDGEHSFVPRWRPAFVTALAPEDRCHLNGLAMRDGVPRYVTCLGATDAAGGWRDNKRNGGLLLDVTSGEVMLTGLSMPHSPRWHQERLWLLESGEGGIGHVEGGRIARWHGCPASRAASTSWDTWRSWGCRRCARRPCSAACR